MRDDTYGPEPQARLMYGARETKFLPITRSDARVTGYDRLAAWRLRFAASLNREEARKEVVR